MEFVREGDVLVVKSLDRLARSVIHLLQIQARLEAKGCSLKIMDLGLDTSDSTGRFFLQIMGSVAEFERTMMLERQKIGIAKAKAAGKYKGRKPTARTKKVRGAEALSRRSGTRSHCEGIGDQSCERVSVPIVSGRSTEDRSAHLLGSEVFAENYKQPTAVTDLRLGRIVNKFQVTRKVSTTYVPGYLLGLSNVPSRFRTEYIIVL